jgi:hypothetical protein
VGGRSWLMVGRGWSIVGRRLMVAGWLVVRGWWWVGGGFVGSWILGQIVRDGRVDSLRFVNSRLLNLVTGGFCFLARS